MGGEGQKVDPLNQGDPSKKWFFWSSPYKMKVIITSPFEMVELANFGLMTTFKI